MFIHLNFAKFGFQVLSSDVVVLEWGNIVFGKWGVIFSFLVAISASGSALASTLSYPRQFACLAREGIILQSFVAKIYLLHFVATFFTRNACLFQLINEHSVIDIETASHIFNKNVIVYSL